MSLATPKNAPSTPDVTNPHVTASRAMSRRRAAALIAAFCFAPVPAFADVSEGASALSAPMSPASRIAAQVQSFYDRTDTFQTRFSQTYFHAAYRRTERANGELVLDKPGRMRFDYDGGKVLVSSGTYLTMFDPGDAGEAGQYMKMRSSEDSLHQGFGFLMGSTRIDEDYSYRLLDAQRYGWNGSVLELRPRSSDPRVSRVLLYVDARSGREGVVHRIRIDDHEGNRNTLTFRRMRFNRPVAAARFRYSPPLGSIRMHGG